MQWAVVFEGLETEGGNRRMMRTSKGRTNGRGKKRKRMKGKKSKEGERERKKKEQIHQLS